jgi:hypothetical protein
MLARLANFQVRFFRGIPLARLHPLVQPGKPQQETGVRSQL